MKSLLLIATICMLLPVLSQAQQVNLVGAWETGTDEDKIVMICSDKYFAATVYDEKNKTYKGTCGGTYRVENNTFIEQHEFNTLKPELIGKEVRTPIKMKTGKLVFAEADGKREWKKLDDGTPGKLAGAWLITGRMEGDTKRTITPGARRTMKILSGTRFQWIAYNVETKEFFGTGGGTYTTEGNAYTENIAFFSRDNSRVGQKLTFDFSLDSDGNWRHKGLSSKGDPIDEVWTKREKLGL